MQKNRNYSEFTKLIRNIKGEIILTNLFKNNFILEELFYISNLI